MSDERIINRARKVVAELEEEEELSMIEVRAILSLALAMSLAGPPGPQGSMGPPGPSSS